MENWSPLRSIPRPTVALPWGSRSITRTRFPISAIAAPLLTVGGFLLVSDPPEGGGERWNEDVMDELGFKRQSLNEGPSDQIAPFHVKHLPTNTSRSIAKRRTPSKGSHKTTSLEKRSLCRYSNPARVSIWRSSDLQKGRKAHRSLI